MTSSPLFLVDCRLFLIDSMCMFVRLVKRNNNRVSIQIVENNRFGDKVKQKVILHMGQFDKDDTKEIDFQKRVGRKDNHREEKQNKSNLSWL